MIIEYPEKLLTQVKQATKDNRLTGFVPGMGSRHPHLVLIGEAPGREEIKQGRPFVGSSGKELTKMVELAGLTRDELYITSVVRSRPYNIKHVKNARGEVVEKHPNRTPTKREVKAFGHLFDWEISQLDATVLVPLGNTSLQRLIGGQAKIGDLHAQVLHQQILHLNAQDQYELAGPTYWIIPMYHPAAYLYARRLEDTVKHDWRQLGQWLQEQDKH